MVVDITHFNTKKNYKNIRIEAITLVAQPVVGIMCFVVAFLMVNLIPLFIGIMLFETFYCRIKQIQKDVVEVLTEILEI